MSERHDETPQPPSDGRADVLENEPRPRRPRRPGRLIAWSTVGLLAAAAVAGGGYAATQGGAGSGSPAAGVVAQAEVAAATPSASPTVPGPRSHQGGHHGALPGGFGLLGPHRGLGLGRVLHGEVTVTTANGGTRLVDVQRGSVTAKQGNALTVKSSDNVTFSYVLDAKTRIVDFDVAKPRLATVADLKVGDTVRVVATRANTTDNTRTATLVVVGQPKDRPGAHPMTPPGANPNA